MNRLLGGDSSGSIAASGRRSGVGKSTLLCSSDKIGLRGEKSLSVGEESLKKIRYAHCGLLNNPNFIY